MFRLTTFAARMPSLPQDAKALERRFRQDRSGAVAVVFAILFVVLFSVVAVTVDFGLSSVAKVRQQRALDAATLAASDRLGLPDQDVSAPAIAQAYYNANTKKLPANKKLTKLTLDPSTGKISSAATTSVFSTLLKGIGIQNIDVNARSVVIKGQSTVEVAMVLDNSGSMSPEIENLKTAAKNLIGILFTGLEGTDRMRVGLVPFAASVNVGPQYASASWVDSAGLSPIHFENFDGSRPRLQVFADLGQTWKGCVESRPSPLDTNDAPADPNTPSTLFVPMFAPDEPDSVNSNGDSYSNSYLTDDSGSCPPQQKVCEYYSKHTGDCKRWSKVPIAPATAQERLCKYVGQAVSGGGGPNSNCTTTKILPLTNSKSQVTTAIESMIANGYTNILQGTMWGWRVLSPGVPFTEGRSYSVSDNRKYLIIMTDGENTYQSKTNHNGSMYGGFGYKAKGRIGVTGSMTSEMDAKTMSACASAKAEGVQIYTIAFRDAVTNASARMVLNSCASDSSRALTAADGAALTKAFEEIGRQISQLRVAG